MLGRVAAGTEVTLTATPETGSRFSGWSGECSGSSTTCSITMDGDQSVDAAFEFEGLKRFSSIVDLGTLPSGGNVEGRAINNDGWNTGVAYDANRDQRAFRWSPEDQSMVDLGSFGGMGSDGLGINANGWVVGWAVDSAAYAQAFLCAPAPSTTLIDLALGGQASVANGINRDIWIVGSIEMADRTSHVFRRAPNGVVTDLGTLGGNRGAAYDINDAGWTVGDSQLPDGSYHAFRVGPAPDTTLEDLGTLPGGGYSLARRISETGAIVGESSTSSGSQRAILIDPPPARAMKDLGTLGGANSNAYGINASGQVVGGAETSIGGNHAFLWDPRRMMMVDLNDLLPESVSGWELRLANDINDAGVITGTGTHNGQLRAFALSP